VKDLWRND